MSKKENNNVSVGVRIRPRNDKEIQASMPVCFSASGDARDVQELNEDGDVVKHWSYDNVFGPENNNKFIFEAMGMRLVDAAMDGYNSVLFMYGQTSSGKTFTLFGGGGTAGLVQHSMEYLHAKIMASTDTEYVVRLTYAELYNEELRDLLAPNPSTEGLKIIDDPQLGPLIQNITEANFTTAADVKQLLDEGENRRHFGVTNMNAHSSRSHVMVRLSIETRRVQSKPTNPLRSSWGKDKPSTVSTLNLVDLAGSERATKSGTSGQALKEGSYINKSLLTLGTVISNLSEGKGGTHIPYRDSKLTRLLSTALGGNAKTCMITCISPASGNVVESLSTLRFASRAKRIVNIVQKNEIPTVKSLSTKLAIANNELEQVKAQLDRSRAMGFLVDEDAPPGETLKDKAVMVSRNMRNLRFLMTNTPKLVKGLKQIGMPHLVKKVQADLKSAITGGRELSEIIEEHTTLITTYLMNDRKMLQRVQVLNEENESERILGNGEEADAELAESDSGDDILDMDSEEMREQIECALLSGEDLRAIAVTHIAHLERDLADVVQRERAARGVIEEQKSSILALDEKVKRHETNEKGLQHTIKSRDDDLDEAHQNTQKLLRRIKELEDTVEDKEKTINAKDHTLTARDGEIARLKTQTEGLENDLNAAVISRRQFEEETSRARLDMRTQMEKMRNTMHHLLQQGGEEAKVIETQNEMLQKELDSVKDYLEEETKSKERLELEMSHLRGNIAMLQDEQRVHISEMNICKKENAELAQKVKDSRWKLIKMSSSLTVSEEHNQQLKRKYDEDLTAKEDALSAQQADFRARQEQADAKCMTALAAHDRIQQELAAALEQVDAKVAVITRLEHTLSADTARFEKKIHAQSKHNEDMAVELTNANAQMHVVCNKHIEEVKTLKHKIADLQGVVDAINKHIEEQVAELCDRPDDEGSGSPHSPGNSSYYYRDSLGSAYSRHDSFAGDFSPMVDRGVSFYLGPRRNLPDLFGDQTPNRDYTEATTPLTIEGATEIDEAGNEVKRDLDFSPAPRSHSNGVSPIKSALKSSQTKSNTGPLAIETSAGMASFGLSDEPSPQFLRLHAAMSMLTTSLTHSINEDRILRNFTLDQQFKLMDRTQTDSVNIQYLEDKQEYLEEKCAAQQDSLQFSRELEGRTAERVAVAEAEYQQLKNQYLVCVRNEQAAIGNAAKFEQMYLDLRLQLDRVRKEKKHYMDSGMDTNVRCLELEAKIEEDVEAYSVLQSQFQLLEQELGVLKVERDELMKRFLRNGVYPPVLSATSPVPPPSPLQQQSSTGSFNGSLSRGYSHSSVLSSAPVPASTPAQAPPKSQPFSPAPAAPAGMSTPSLYRNYSDGTNSSTSAPAPSTQQTPGTSARTPYSVRNPYSSDTPALSLKTTSFSPLPANHNSNNIGLYSTLTPQGKPSEAFISLFGNNSLSSNL